MAMDIHDRLRIARKRAGYPSAAAAARRLSMVVPTYSGHENGSRGITRKKAATYAAFFKVDLFWLLTGDGEPDGSKRLVEKIESLDPLLRAELERYIDFLQSRPR